MKIYLNLLPPEKKQEIVRKQKIRLIIKQEIMFIFPLIVFIIFLFGINIVLKIQVKSFDRLNAAKQSGEEYRQLKIYEDKFKEINERINYLLSLEAKHLYWSNILFEMEKIIPENIQINSLSSKNYRISLLGKARQRNDLLKFRENIENAECFEEINIPLSNLVVKENVDFQMDFQIKERCFIGEKYE